MMRGKDQTGWLKLMQNGMKKDFSWAASAREYVKIYERLSPPKPGPQCPASEVLTHYYPKVNAVNRV